jgi:cytochrome c556
MRRMALVLGAMALGIALLGSGLAPVQAQQGITEADFDAMMKRVGPAFGGLRKSLEGSSAQMAAENAAVLRQAFTETNAFWAARGKADAAEWATEAGKVVEALDAQAKAGNWEAAKATAGDLQGFCAKCHGAYRDKAEDGTWRIKPGS